MMKHLKLNTKVLTMRDKTMGAFQLLKKAEKILHVSNLGIKVIL